MPQDVVSVLIGLAIIACVGSLAFIATEFFDERGYRNLQRQYRKRALESSKRIDDIHQDVISASLAQVKATEECVVAQKAATVAYDEYRALLVSASNELKKVWNPAGTNSPGGKKGDWHKN